MSSFETQVVLDFVTANQSRKIGLREVKRGLMESHSMSDGTVTRVIGDLIMKGKVQQNGLGNLVTPKAPTVATPTTAPAPVVTAPAPKSAGRKGKSATPTTTPAPVILDSDKTRPLSGKPVRLASPTTPTTPTTPAPVATPRSRKSATPPVPVELVALRASVKVLSDARQDLIGKLSRSRSETRKTELSGQLESIGKDIDKQNRKLAKSEKEYQKSLPVATPTTPTTPGDSSRATVTKSGIQKSSGGHLPNRRPAEGQGGMTPRRLGNVLPLLNAGQRIPCMVRKGESWMSGHLVAYDPCTPTTSQSVATVALPDGTSIDRVTTNGGVTVAQDLAETFDTLQVVTAPAPKTRSRKSGDPTTAPAPVVTAPAPKNAGRKGKSATP